MGELRLRADSSYGTTDLLVQFDDQVTMGDLADELEVTIDRSAGQPRSIQRASRGEVYFSRETRVAQADLRSGDEIRLALDSGLRAVGGSAAVASLRVVDGADAGRAFDLRRGESAIGRSASCEVTIDDHMASRRHAIIRVSDIVEIVDNGSTNGVAVNDEPIVDVKRLRPADRVLIGDTTVTIGLLKGRHDVVDVVDNNVEFNRPPRMERPFESAKVTLPAPLDPPPKQRLPMATALAPLLMGLVMFIISSASESTSLPLFSFVFMGLSPVMAVASYVEGRVSGRKEYEAKLIERNAVLVDQVAALDRYREEEIRSAFRFAPGLDDLHRCVDELSPLLWERVPTDDDFLRFRIGLKSQPSRMEIDVARGGRREDRFEAEELANGYRTLPEVPVTVDARSHGPVGLAGETESRLEILRSLVVQVAALHSPKELLLGAILTEQSAVARDWMKWLPHTQVTPAGVDRSLTAVGADEGIELVAALQKLIELRMQDDRLGHDRPIYIPHLLIVIDGSIGIDRSRFTRLLDDGSRVGVTVLWETTDARRIPNSCGATISVEPGGATVTVGVRSSGLELGGVAVEGLSHEPAEVVARNLAPVVDISADMAGTASLPGSVSLVDLLGGLEVLESPKPFIERWTQSAGGKALRAPIGVHEGGTLSVDLRADGPHGLVGGTTGAGKSEFLQGYLAALAASHSPERLNFLLVDYKGGSAFGRLVNQFDHDGRRISRGLPHTVGMITDLTPALVDRALESLQAELHRRETILAGPPQVQDLIEMEKRGLPDTPPSLLIVVDEFAALAKEVPKFVEGVVDIAQRGRSLGLHLLLATQKPGGVITANIQANTNLRVALRTATEDESRDLVNAPDAGLIDRTNPGRGLIRRGPSDLVRFQSSYVGGFTEPAISGTLAVAEFDVGSLRLLSEAEVSDEAPSKVTDLTRIVGVINEAAAELDLPRPRRPWLDPLPSSVDLLDLLRPQDDSAVVYGVVDLPDKQTRQLATFRPDEDGSLLIYGMGGTGKTVALRTLAVAFGLTKDRSPVHIHGLDFAGRGLDMLKPLPHVGSIIQGDDYERVTRLLATIRSDIDTRSNTLSKAQASTLTDYRRATGEDLPRTVVLLDGYDNFLANFERVDGGRWTEAIPRLVADGRQVGVHFLLTGSRRASFPIALASQIPGRLVFRMASDDDYHAVNVDPKWFDSTTPPGRGRLGDREIQVAIVGGDRSTAAEAAKLRLVGDGLRDVTAEAPKVRALPTEVMLSELPQTASGAVAWALTDAFTAVGPSLRRHLLVVGTRQSGRSTALASLHRALSDGGVTAMMFEARGSGACPGIGSMEDLAKHLEAGCDDVVLIDDFEQVTGGPADLPLQEAMKSGLVVVGATDTLSARTLASYEPNMKALRAHCDTLILQPTAGADDDVLGAAIPRTSHQFPPGRGYFNAGGQTWLVQVAIP